MPEMKRLLQEALPDGFLQAENQGEADETLHIERALVPIYIFDAESHAMLAANAAALRLYGYDEAAFLRLGLEDIRPPEEAGRARRCAETWPPGLRYAGVWRHKAADGRVFPVHTLGLRVAFEGRPAILTIVYDLMQTLRPDGAPAVPSRALFPFAEQIEEVACCVRSLADGRVAYVNPAVARVFGLTREAVYADPAAVERLVPVEDLGDFLRYLEASRQGPAQAEYRIRRPDGELRWIASRSFILVDAAGERMAAGFSTDATARKQAEQRRLALLEDQRDALVRETGHRIKNSLQGATGLLRRAAAARPQLAPALAEVAAQLQSLAVVHGLQARTASGRVELCALLRGIAAAAESLGQAHVEASIPPDCDPCLLVAERDAVPLALAVNELVTNAVRHARPGSAVRVAVEPDLAAATAQIRIVNAGSLPPDIRAASGGSGLELVRMLLPPKGARFELAGADGKVTATLRLKAPVIQPPG